MMNLNLQKRTMSGQDSPLSGENAGQKEAEFTTDVEKPAPTATPAPTPEPTPEPVFVYTIPENALSGMEPDPEGYHESMEAAELAAFLQREEVQTLVDGRKLCGILCERVEDRVIVGLGVNVRQMRFAPEIEERATSLLRELGAGPDVRVPDVREHVLEHLGDALAQWRGGGFRSVWPAICRLDFLKGRELSVLRVENDAAPVKGVCDGIGPDGALLVAGIPVYAGEAHVMV